MRKTIITMAGVLALAAAGPAFAQGRGGGMGGGGGGGMGGGPGGGMGAGPPISPPGHGDRGDRGPRTDDRPGPREESETAGAGKD